MLRRPDTLTGWPSLFRAFIFKIKKTKRNNSRARAFGGEQGDGGGYKGREKEKNTRSRVPFVPGLICGDFASGSRPRISHSSMHIVRGAEPFQTEFQQTTRSRQTIRPTIDFHPASRILCGLKGSDSNARFRIRLNYWNYRSHGNWYVYVSYLHFHL